MVNISTLPPAPRLTLTLGLALVVGATALNLAVDNRVPTINGAASASAVAYRGNPPATTLLPPVLLSVTVELVAAINALRLANGLGPLTVSASLTACAEAHSTEMATTLTLSHTGVDGSTPSERCGQPVGEVLAAGLSTVAEAVAAWAASPPHSAILLEPTATTIGVAAAIGTDGAIYWTAELA